MVGADAGNNRPRTQSEQMMRVNFNCDNSEAVHNLFLPAKCGPLSAYSQNAS
jgi:hypothetical protein